MIQSYNFIYENENDLSSITPYIDKLNPQNHLIQIFTGIIDEEYIRNMINGINTLFPGIAVIGTTSSGEIMANGFSNTTTVINLSVFEKTSVESILYKTSQTLKDDVHQLSKKLYDTNAKLMILFNCGRISKDAIVTVESLKDMKRLNPSLVIAGGRAANGGHEGPTYVFTEKGISHEGFVVAILKSETLKIYKDINLSWIPIGKKMTITEMEGNTIKLIDNMTPKDLYSKYIGEEFSSNLTASYGEFPLCIERDQGIELLMFNTIQHDGSIEFLNALHVGEQVTFSYCQTDQLIKTTNRIVHDIQNKNIEVAFIYSCEARKWILGDDVQFELSLFSKLCTTSGFFSGGEYYTDQLGTPHLYIQTMSLLALSESEPKLADKETSPTISMSENRAFRSLRALHRLMENTTSEMTEMYQQMSTLANKDALTGIANRRYFQDTLEDEIKRHQRLGLDLTLILFDVDYFKQYNDTYGHVAGDDALRGIGQVLKEYQCRPSDVVARFGGEEFALILPQTNFEGGMAVAQKIRQKVMDLQIPHSSSKVSKFLTISLGQMTVRLINQISPQDLLQACDKLLYQAKTQGRNQVQGQYMEY